MQIKVKLRSIAFIAIAAAALLPASQGTANASGCVKPGAATNKSTVKSRKFGAEYKEIKLEVRRGKVNGVWYNWARISGDTQSNDYVYLRIDHNGDGDSDIACKSTVTDYAGSAYTAKHKESSSSSVRVRAYGCWKRPLDNKYVCGETNWW